MPTPRTSPLPTGLDKVTSICTLSPAVAPESTDTSFIEDAVSQLLMSRRVLKASYGYGFFLVGNKEKKTPYEQEKKTIFELMQVIRPN